MPNLENIIHDVGRLDLLSRQDTWVHRIDPRAKLVATAAFLITLASFGAHDVTPLLPLLLFPTALVLLGNVPLAYLGRKLLVAAPFVLLIGIWNPIFDREPAADLFGVSISGGWLSFASITLRLLLTVTTALALVAVTGFFTFCSALRQLGVPRVLVVQLLLLYRYVFVLAGESLRTVRAYSLRSGSVRGVRLTFAGSVLGHLMLRTIDRARHVHEAMLCRGFDGDIRIASHSAIRAGDVSFAVAWVTFFVVVRLQNLPLALGRLFVGSN